MLSIARVLHTGTKIIKHSSSPSLDTEVLLPYVLDCDRTHVISHSEQKLNLAQIIKFFWLILRRRYGTPVAYLIGTKEFYGRTFEVNKHTLIPRPETELLIDISLRLISDSQANINALADIGTGSGCIAVTLAYESPQLPIYATDISAAALHVAQTNATTHNATSRIKFLSGDLLTPLINANLLTPQTLIVTNLPYLSSEEIIGEVKHEPRQALVANEHGLELYRQLFSQLVKLPNDIRPLHLIAESHSKTATQFDHLFHEYFPNGQIVIHSDLQGRPRIFELQLA